MDITEKLFKFNPWWEKEFSPSFINREKYLKILEKYLANPDIILITGLRRVGKTSLMKLLISRLLKTVESKFILYVSLDSIALEPFKINEILRAYRKIFRLSLDERIYLFFDEVGVRENIHRELKNLYDSENVKIYASSSSASILQDTGAFLIGRSRIVEVMPLDFQEFLLFLT